jgi:hypothetical protein
MEIQYDPSKAESNESKHGVSFDEATSVLFDPMGLIFEDNDSEYEHRWVLLGMSNKDRLLVVVYTLRDDEIIRLISARKATRKEVKQYA